MYRICGGTGKEFEATEKVISVCNAVREKIEKRLDTKFELYVPISARSQLVAGINYFVKIQVGDGKYIHARIYEVPWKAAISLTAVLPDKRQNDPLEYF